MGLTVLADIIKENPQIDHEYVSSAILEMAVKGLKLEDAFARFTYRDLPGMSADAYLEHCRFQMKLGLRRLGLVLPDCDDATPALPWVSETVELRRETNFSSVDWESIKSELVCLLNLVIYLTVAETTCGTIRYEALHITTGETPCSQ